jgi:hypothetical protein
MISRTGSFEAAHALGVSERQVKYWITDGTLLAINAARDPLQHTKPVNERGNRRDYWRVVVRRAGFEEPRYKKYLTLEELINRYSNRETAP